jgi:hypothetical protein
MYVCIHTHTVYTHTHTHIYMYIMYVNIAFGLSNLKFYSDFFSNNLPKFSLLCVQCTVNVIVNNESNGIKFQVSVISSCNNYPCALPPAMECTSWTYAQMVIQSNPTRLVGFHYCFQMWKCY